MTGVFLERDNAGLPRSRCILVVFFLQVALTDSVILAAPAPLARKTRRGPSVTDRGSAEVTAAVTRLLLPLLGLDGSVESGDGLAAFVESPVVPVPGRVLKISSSSESISLYVNCYDP